jgi:precorrin-6y C5,15-methyltransferase (decarboxylating) CbiE subunit
MAARLKKSWHDAYITSMHGRIDENLVHAVAGQKMILALTDTKNSPNEIAKFLIENGITGKKAAVGENLSYPDERLMEGTLEEIAQMNNFKMSVMVIYNE